jgi:hypothetical protein
LSAVIGGSLVLCIAAPFALLGVLFMVQVRLVLAQQCAQLLAPSWRAPDEQQEGPAWRITALAAANILVPLLASCFGLAALASHLGIPLVSGILHGINVVQGVLGLGLLAQIVRRKASP